MGENTSHPATLLFDLGGRAVLPELSGEGLLDDGEVR